jgi:hypothetical protein
MWNRNYKPFRGTNVNPDFLKVQSLPTIDNKKEKKRNKLDIYYPLVHIAVEAYYLFIAVRYRCLQKFSIVPVAVEQNANYRNGW